MSNQIKQVLFAFAADFLRFGNHLWIDAEREIIPAPEFWYEQRNQMTELLKDPEHVKSQEYFGLSNNWALVGIDDLPEWMIR